MHTFPNLGPKLKESRIKSNLTRSQVSEALGISVSAIGLYECGERIPSLYVLVKLAAKYNVSLDYLLDNQQSQPNCIYLDGLSEKEARLLKEVADCFRL